MNGVDYFVVGLFVVVYGWARYNTPKTNRATTTGLQFYLTGAAYVFSCLVLYFLLSIFIYSHPEALKIFFLDATDAQSSDQLKGIAPPLIAALLMTTLLPNIPLLRTVDQALLNFFQRLGNIPSKVQWVSREIVEANCTTESLLTEGGQRDLDNLLSFPDELRPMLVPCGPPPTVQKPGTALEEESPDIREARIRYRFSRIVLMFLSVERWAASPRFSAFFNDFADRHTKLTTDFNAFLEDAKDFFPHLAEIKKIPACEAPNSPLTMCRNTFKSRADAMHRELSEFMALALLSSERRTGDVMDRLRQIGFLLPEERPGSFDLNHLLTVMFAIFALLVGSGLVAGTFLHNETPIYKWIAIAFTVATTYGVAVTFAVYPKYLWRFADVRKVGHRPTAAYFASGLLAVAVAAAIWLFFQVNLNKWDIDAGVQDFLIRAPWLTMTFVTAVTLAFLCDDNAGSPEGDPGWLRWAEGLAMALVLVGASFLVRQWITDMGGRPGDWRLSIPIALCIGFWLGSTVPHWHRTYGEEVREKRQSAAALDKRAVASAG